MPLGWVEPTVALVTEMFFLPSLSKTAKSDANCF